MNLLKVDRNIFLCKNQFGNDVDVPNQREKSSFYDVISFLLVWYQDSMLIKIDWTFSSVSDSKKCNFLKCVRNGTSAFNAQMIRASKFEKIVLEPQSKFFWLKTCKDISKIHRIRFTFLLFKQFYVQIL